MVYNQISPNDICHSSYNLCNQPIDSKFQHPPPLRQPTGFWLSSACVFRGGEFEPCLAGVGNLSWKSEGFKSWSMSRKSWLLILPLTKKLGGAFEHSFELGHTNLKKFKWGGGGWVLKFHMDWISNQWQHIHITSSIHVSSHLVTLPIKNGWPAYT